MKVYYNIEKVNDERCFYKFDQLTRKNESLVIEFMAIKKNAITDLWFAHGNIASPLNAYLSVRTYVSDDKGNCYERYNPTVRNDNHMINFKWVMEDTKDNREKMLDEIVKQAYGPNAEAFINDSGTQKNPKKWKVNKYGIITRGFTVEQCIERHKMFWEHWPYFDEPRKVWRDEYDRLCIEYVRKDDLSTTFYRYTIENGVIVWG